MKSLTWLYVATIVPCVIAGMPTVWWRDIGIWFRDWHVRAARRAAERELRRLAVPFQAEKSFLPRGVGLAFDFTRELFFIAAPKDGHMHGIVLPFSAVRGVASGEARDSGFYDYYVELKVDDSRHPFWRLVCGEDPALAQEIRQSLETLVPA
jgi:hypothetical protein